MTSKDVQPSSLNGIKRLANQLKKSNGYQHHEALNIAARAASFENFNHARNQLQNLTVSNQLYLTAYWYDTKSYQSGRETIKIELSKPLTKITSKSELKEAKGLGWFRVAAEDHLVSDKLFHSLPVARSYVCMATRALRFMEATGLKPAKHTNAIYPNGDIANKIPKCDHTTDWYVPKTGQFIMIDEPYNHIEENAERTAWAKKHNWHLKMSIWPGIHNPYHCNLFVATDASKNYDFQRLMSKIDAIPAPITQDKWNGVSAEDHAPFISPLAATPQDNQRAKSKGTIWRFSSKKTIPLHYRSSNNERRPNASMPIATHLEIARLIKALTRSSAKPYAVNYRLDAVRSKLEDWFFAEHSREETDKHDLFYYGEISDDDPFIKKTSSTKGVIQQLNKLKDTLKTYYIDCEPLRKMVSKTDAAIKITTKFDCAEIVIT